MTLIRKKGLTLLEVIIVVLLFSVILAALFSALATARNSWASGGSQLSVQQEARKGLAVITEELRQARLSTIVGVPDDGANYNSITFQIPSTITAGGTTWSTNIQYSVGGLNNAQLIRTQDSAQRVLANNISSLIFSRSALKPDVINAAVSAQKNTLPGFTSSQSSITLNSKIKVRN